MNGYELSQQAAVAMWNGAASTLPDGSPVWKRQHGMMFGRYVPKQPNGSADSFRPDVDARHTSEFVVWFLARELAAGHPINYRVEIIYRQDPSAPRDVHPVPQIVLYRAIYEREHVIAPGAAIYECVHHVREMAELIATLAACNAQ